MANGGWYGTQEEWLVAERPLAVLDPAFKQFAETHEFKLTKNHKDWPERSLTKQIPLKSLIQFYRSELGKDAWKVWVVCSDDRGDERFWKRTLVAEDITADQLSQSLSALLTEALGLLVAWNAHPEDLEFAAKIARLP